MRARALPLLIAIVAATFWSGFLGLQHISGRSSWLDRGEATLTDIRALIRGARPSPDLVTIVAIDDEVAQVVGGYPLPREVMAKVIAGVARMKPKSIAVDVLFVDPGKPEGDNALARALSSVPSVIAAAAIFGSDAQLAQSSGPFAHIPEADRLLLPSKVFSDVSAVGVVNVSTDRSGTPRAVPMLFHTTEQIAPSLTLRAASLALKAEPVFEPGSVSIGTRTTPTDFGQSVALAFYGPRGSVKTVSAADILAGTAEASQITGRVVVIGATVTGAGDVFPTPFDPVLPGVEVVATAISHLLAGDALVRDRSTRIMDASIAICLPLLLIGLLAWRRSAMGFALIAASCILVVGGNVLAFNHGFAFSLALPIAAAAPPAILFGAAQMWLGRHQANEFASQSELLQRIQAPGLSKWLARDKDFLSEPISQNAAVVFVDLSGFTGLSETVGPDQTRELIDSFYGHIAEEVEAAGGMITSFMGDGVMILFGPPEPTMDDAASAVRCCVKLAGRTASWLATLPQNIASRTGFKIGAHFGVVVTSRLGRGDNQQIATTGDTVNVASRLMGVAAANHVPLAVSDTLLSEAGQEAFAGGVLSGPLEVSVRGRAGSLAVWLWAGATEPTADAR